jgi:hypothetical protein
MVFGAPGTPVPLVAGPGELLGDGADTDPCGGSPVVASVADSPLQPSHADAITHVPRNQRLLIVTLRTRILLRRYALARHNQVGSSLLRNCSGLCAACAPDTKWGADSR